MEHFVVPIPSEAIMLFGGALAGGLTLARLLSAPWCHGDQTTRSPRGGVVELRVEVSSQDPGRVQRSASVLDVRHRRPLIGLKAGR